MLARSILVSTGSLMVESDLLKGEDINRRYVGDRGAACTEDQLASHEIHLAPPGDEGDLLKGPLLHKILEKWV
jgi:hypothetical protein